MRSLLAAFVLVALSASAWAAEEPNEKVLSKEISGTVSAASSSGVAVEYDISKEVFLPVGKETKYEKVVKSADLKHGDTVKVAYEQVFREDAEGKWKLVGTRATKVSLLRKAPEEGALISTEAR